MPRGRRPVPSTPAQQPQRRQDRGSLSRRPVQRDGKFQPRPAGGTDTISWERKRLWRPNISRLTSQPCRSFRAWLMRSDIRVARAYRVVAVRTLPCLCRLPLQSCADNEQDRIAAEDGPLNLGWQHCRQRDAPRAFDPPTRSGTSGRSQLAF